MSRRPDTEAAPEPATAPPGAVDALRVGHRIVVSGLAGEGDSPAGALRTAVERLQRALDGLGATLADVVRTRLWFIDPADFLPLGAAHGAAFRAIRPAMSLTQVHFLSPGARLLLEAEAVIGAAATRQTWGDDVPYGEAWGYAGIVRVGDELWTAGVTAAGAGGDVIAPGDLNAQGRCIAARIASLLAAGGARPTDIVSTRHFTAVAYAGGDTGAERLALMHPHHPTSAGITVQGVGLRQAGLLVEVEAVVGATEGRRNRATGRPYEEAHHYSRSVRMGEVVAVSGTTSVQLSEEVGSPFDAYGQTLQALEWVRWGVEHQDLPFDDLARVRAYVVGEENLTPVRRALDEVVGPIRPAATVVGVPALGRPSILVEVEGTAFQGAAQGRRLTPPASG